MSRKSLTRACFDDHPVWEWDERMEGHVPVESFDPLPSDRGTLFIRARFVAASGDRFTGYVVGGDSPYAVGLFVGAEEFVLNLRLPEMIEADSVRIAELIGADSLTLFPLRYADDAGFRRSDPVRGELRL